MGPVIALIGAESTGKTTLARALAETLCERGERAVVVGEWLREFCDAERRMPRPDEQQGIAAAQWRRIEAAARDGSTVIADTTPLMTAVYSEHLFADRSLHASALELQRRCQHTLLTGLDLRWQPDPQRDGPQVRGPIDALLRAALASAGLPFAVVYGQGEARCAAALAALRRPAGAAAATTPQPPPTRYRGRCSECLQPGCEHLRLLPTTISP